MFLMPFFLLVINFFICISSTNIYKQKILSPTQWSQIRRLLQNPELTSDIKQKLQNVIYVHYKNWAIYKAMEFKKVHCFKCRNIKTNELSLYSIKGLVSAIRNYNASYPFSPFANFYIDGELYRGLTMLQPITLIPKSQRISKQWRLNNKKYYKKSLIPKMIGFDNYIFEKNQKMEDDDNAHSLFYLDEYKQQWDNIYNILNKDPYLIRIFKYKYDYQFNKIRSNKQISQLLCCSEETIRKAIVKIKLYLSKETLK